MISLICGILKTNEQTKETRNKLIEADNRWIGGYQDGKGVKGWQNG